MGLTQGLTHDPKEASATQSNQRLLDFVSSGAPANYGPSITCIYSGKVSPSASLLFEPRRNTVHCFCCQYCLKWLNV